MNYLICIIFCLIIFNNEYDCKSSRKGIFIINDEVAGRTIIQRNDSIQLESNKKQGTILLQKIKWLNDCDYEIYDTNILKNTQNLPFKNNKVKVTIDKFKDSIYNVTVFIIPLNFKMPIKMKKVRDNLSDEFFKFVNEHYW